MPALLDGKPLSGKDSLYVSAVIDSVNSELIVKLVNAGEKPENFELNLSGIKSLKGGTTITTLSAGDLYSFNEMEKPLTIVPVVTTAAVKGKKIQQLAGPRSFIVIRVKYVR